MGNYLLTSDVLVEALRADAVDEKSTHDMGGDIVPLLVKEGGANVYDFTQNEVPGSTDRDWHETVIPHKTQLIEASPDGHHIRLRNTLADGVIVDHEIEARHDEVEFHVVARNPTDKPSEAHWAQPCVRVDTFTGVEAKPNSEVSWSR